MMPSAVGVVDNASNVPPAYLQPVFEPDFGTEIERISDPTAMGVDLSHRRFIRNAYAKVQPWNADESLLLLGYNWGGVLLDGKTYQFIRTVWQPNQARWSNTDPHILFGVLGNRLVKQDYSNIRDRSAPNPPYQMIREFSEFDSISIGEGEGSFSLDDRWVALQARKGEQTFLVLHNLKTNRVVQTDLNGGWPDNVSVSPTGKWVIVEWKTSGTERNQGIEVYRPWLTRLTFARQLSPYSTHFDVGLDTNRKEVIVLRDPAVWENGIVKISVDTGKMTKVYWGDGSNQPSWSGSHVSFQNSQRPGWVYWSDYAPSRQAGLPGFQQVYAIKLDGSRTVERFAYSRPGEDIDVYGTQPMAVPNRSGTRVLFGSTWNGAAGAVVNSYVASKLDVVAPVRTS